MRYKYIALLALAVMLVGVLGIYSGDSEHEDDKKPVTEMIDVVYYKASRELYTGMLINKTDFIKVSEKLKKESSSDWLINAMSEMEFDKFMTSGGVIQNDLETGTVLKDGDILSLADKIDSELIAIPLSVSMESVQNPKIRNTDFVDIYLISNDNKIYRDDIYKKSTGGGSGKDYKDTRVKKFASNVWVNKAPTDGKSKEGSSGLSIMDPSDLVEQNGSKSRLNDDGVSRKLIYAWFKREDLDTVIQAQVLGSFFVSPRNIDFLPSNLSELVIYSREVTAADIVSGAPLAETKSKVVEIRGAGNATRNN